MSRCASNSSPVSVRLGSLSLPAVLLLCSNVPLAQPANAAVYGLWDMTAYQTVLVVANGTSAAGTVPILCAFQGKVNISQSGETINGSIQLDNIGQGSGREECADFIATDFNGSISGNAISFSVSPGFGHSMMVAGEEPWGGDPDGINASLIVSTLDFEGTVNGDSMTGIWGVSLPAGIRYTPSGNNFSQLGTFEATRLVEPIPTLSHLGLILLMGMLAAGGAFLFQRGGLG